MTTQPAETLRAAVLAELQSDPRIDASTITVAVRDRAVTLGGSVRSYSEKCCAEGLVRELRGVAVVENEITVRLSVGNYRTDAALSHLTNEMLENHALFIMEAPKAVVWDGWVTLEGIVSSELHRLSAEAIVRDLAGVRGITSRLEVLPPPGAPGARDAFQAALERRPAKEVDALAVDVTGAIMTIRGRVRTCAERDELIQLASRTKGIARVKDCLTVQA